PPKRDDIAPLPPRVAPEPIAPEPIAPEPIAPEPERAASQPEQVGPEPDRYAYLRSMSLPQLHDVGRGHLTLEARRAVEAEINSRNRREHSPITAEQHEAAWRDHAGPPQRKEDWN